jgi:histone H3/H4
MPTKKNQATTERSTEQIMRDLDLARLMREPAAIKRLSAELKKAINKIFTADGCPFPKK